MNIQTLTNGTMSITPPRYSGDFRQAMQAIRARWSGSAYVFQADHRPAVEAAFQRCFPELQRTTPAPSGPFAPLPAVIIPAIGVVVADGATYALVGGSFDTMQTLIKDIDGRRWNPAAKIWEILHRTAVDLAAIVQEAGYQLIPASALPDEEIRQLLAAQQQLLGARNQIEEKIATLDAKISHYSMRSTSTVKAGLAQDRARLWYALEYASEPIETLTEPQIRTMLAVVRDDLEQQ